MLLKIGHLLKVVAAMVVIGVAVALAMAIFASSGLRSGLEVKYLLAVIALAAGAFAWMRRNSTIDWRVGRAIDRLRAKRMGGPVWPGPRMLTMSMDQGVWREALQNIGDECDCLLIDLSTGAVRDRWEIGYLKKHWNGRAVALLDEAASMPADWRALDLPVVRYSPGHGAWHNFVDQLRRTLASMRHGTDDAGLKR